MLLQECPVFDCRYCMIFRSLHLQAPFLCESYSASVVISSTVRYLVHGLIFPIGYNFRVNLIYGKLYTFSMCFNSERHAARQSQMRCIIMEERYSNVGSDRIRRNPTHSTNFSSSGLLHFVCFPGVAVAHGQQASTLVWSASDHTVGKAIGGSVCAWST